MTTVTEFCVELETFGGPPDLLLSLVRRNEIDLRGVPLARITAQFLEFLDALQSLDVDLAGDFVVTASALLEIKSRDVLPGDDEAAADEPPAEAAGNPPSELIRHLLEYKRYRDAAAALEEQAARWQERYPRLSDERPRSGKNPSADRIRDVELWDLVSALGRVLRTRSTETSASIRYDETPISAYIERVSGRVRREGRVAFSSFFEGTDERHRIVGLFLGILELVRHHGFRVEQPAEYGEIWVLPPRAESAALGLAGTVN
ncbi:MAG TPA: segregation/condensation protein A [Planctomycetaceae bacterium]|nr:segregation/condensation protein A [Planctomycetaceae bacterium]